MPIFRKFVEVGRVAYVVGGPDAGKLVSIVNVIDQNRALVDGPCSGVARKEMHFHQLHLTNMKITIPWRGRTSTVRKAWEGNKISEKWAASNWANRVEARRKRAELTDFDRFKLAKAVHARNKIRHLAFRRLLKKVRKTKLQPKKKGKDKKKEAGAKKKAAAAAVASPPKVEKKKEEKKAAPKAAPKAKQPAKK